MYTIGEVAKRLEIPTSTIRYYDKLDLLPSLQRTSGQRVFTQHDMDRLSIIICLKNTGMAIENIKEFIRLYSVEGDVIQEKYKMIEMQKQILVEKIEQLNQFLNHSEFKLWFFDNKVVDGEEPVYSEEAFDSWKKEFEEYKKSKRNSAC
ncbi:MAG: MerR family transcriptional regulator [Bacillota bacterium]